jgi:choice-of-anchor C domain-containing protein
LVNSKITQAINFPAITNHTDGDAGFTITPTASSGLGLTVASTTSSICSVGSNSPNPGWTVNILHAGSCSIQASQAGDSKYTAASPVTQSFTINKQNQTISFASIPPHTFGDADFTVTPTASSGLAVSLTSLTATCFVFSNAPSPGWIIEINAAGTCTLDANQAGNSDFNPAPQVQRLLTVNKANQSITFNPIGTQTLPGTPFGVTVSDTAGLTVSVVSNTTSICSVTSGTVSLMGPGTCSLTASQAGNANYNAATPVTATFDVKTKNLVANGGFETPKLAAGSAATYTAPQKFGGWSVTSGSIDLLDLQWQNKAGNQSIDLAGNAPGTITRTMTLPYGGTYTLQFAYASNPDGAPTIKHMAITAYAPTWTFPVSEVKTFTDTGHTINSMGWKIGKMNFIANAGDVVTVTFQDTDVGTAFGMALDAVSMSAK